jgi:hypothetical protein
MGKKITRTKKEVRMRKSLTREKTKMVIARKLKRSAAAVYLRASKLAVMLGGGRGSFAKSGLQNARERPL